MKESSELTVGDVMTKAPRSIEPHQDVKLALTWMSELGVRHLPVRNGGKLVGILSERDLNLVLDATKKSGAHVTVEEVMISEVFTVPSDRSLGAVAKDMVQRRIGSVLVVGKDQSLAGIFTDTDALKVLAQ